MEKVINGVSCRVVEKEWDVYFDMALTMFEEIVKITRRGSRRCLLSRWGLRISTPFWRS